MSRAPKRDNSTPSLFPFLAVLLCTMGALVLLLVLIVSKAQASAKQMVTEKKQQVEELETQIDLARDKMQSQLEQGRLELEKKRLALQGLEQQIRELTEELSDLKRTATLLDQDISTTAEQERETEEKISKLEEQLTEATSKLKKQIDKPAGNKPIFAIIPYEGTNGTHRRPVYLECTEKGVVIQPEGVLLSLSDLSPPYGPGNPLDASIRTIRSRYASSNQSLTSSAYPLLVVRPSGVRTYALARQAIASWDDQFGYELIDESLELAFPEGEPGLASEIEQAIATARERQSALVMAMPGKYRQFITRQGQGVDNLSFGDEGTDFGSGWVPNGNGGAGSGAGTGGGTNTGATAGNGAGPGRGGYAQNGSYGAGSGAPVVGSDSVAGFASVPQNTTGQSLASGKPTAGTGVGQGGSYFASGNGSGESGFNDGSGVAGTNGTSSSRQGANGQGNYAGGSGAGGTSGNGSASGGGRPGGGPGGSASMGGSSTASSSSQAGGSQSLQNDQFTPNDNSSDPTQPLQMQKSVGGNNRIAQGDSQSAFGNSSSGDYSPTDSPSSNASKRNSKAEPIARQRGRNWAWSEGPPSKKAFVRAVRVVCYSDRWVIMPDNAVGSKQVTINLDNDPQASAEKLAQTISSRVEGWGIAFSDGYWKPELVVDVAPDAEARYVQMARMLEGSGLEIRRRSTPK